MKLEEFKKLSEEADVIPMTLEFLADLETPVSVLARFAENENVFLLESVENLERFGRYSFIGINPKAVFSVEEGKAFLTGQGKKTELPKPPGGPLFALRELLKPGKIAEIPDLPPCFGGAVGFIGYELAAEFEKSLKLPKKENFPDALFMITDEVLVFDNAKHTVKIIVTVHLKEHESPEAAFRCGKKRLAELAASLKQSRKPFDFTPVAPPRLKPLSSRDDYMNMVEKAKEYIREGEIIQTVLSQCFTAECDLPPLQLYRALRHANPSPYTFFLKLGSRILIGSSPETLAKLEKSRAILRPIAGTRKRGAAMTEDIANADELLADAKEKAEHLMLLDLARNDLGRIASPGSVQVKNFMRVERFSQVMHLVSEVESIIGSGYDAFDLVKAAFPAGTLSGAPKIRAMQIIAELEKLPRGAYGGAAGYFSYRGDCDLAITIRTMELAGTQLNIQSGAGIVYDSDPAKEYEETMNKAAALFNAVKAAASNFEVEK